MTLTASGRVDVHLLLLIEYPIFIVNVEAHLHIERYLGPSDARGLAGVGREKEIGRTKFVRTRRCFPSRKSAPMQLNSFYTVVTIT